MLENSVNVLEENIKSTDNQLSKIEWKLEKCESLCPALKKPQVKSISVTSFMKNFDDLKKGYESLMRDVGENSQNNGEIETNVEVRLEKLKEMRINMDNYVAKVDERDDLQVVQKLKTGSSRKPKSNPS